jgi:hypothetical protein
MLICVFDFIFDLSGSDRALVDPVYDKFPWNNILIIIFDLSGRITSGGVKTAIRLSLSKDWYYHFN